MITASALDVSSDPFLLTVVEDMNAVAQVMITPTSLLYNLETLCSFQQ